ncbi:MAG: flagellar hook-associated protein FlgL [Chitinophagales bacterium]
MRITNRMMITQYNRALGSNLERLSVYERMMSSGKRISKPSDDPVGTITDLRMRRKITETEKYQANIDEGTSWMDTTDDAMTQMTTIMHRARELALRGANGTNSQESRTAIGLEIEQLVEQAKDIANSTYGDKYLFSGSNYTEAAYSNGCWSGNDNGVAIEISQGVDVAVNSNMRSFFMGNNYYDLTYDRMPEGEFTANMTTSTLTRIDNLNPNDWRNMDGDNAIFDGFDASTQIVSTLPDSDGTHNVGASLKMEIADITYSETNPTEVVEVKVNLTYRQHDSVAGDSFLETQQLTLNNGTAGVFSSGAVQIGKGKVTIDPIEINTLAAGFGIGSRLVVENTPEDAVIGGPTNLGATATVQKEFQSSTANGQGLTDTGDGSLIADAAFNNYNGSFLFEITEVDAANQRVQVKVKCHLVDKFSGESKYFDTNERIWLNTNGQDNFVDIAQKTKKAAYENVESLQVPEGESVYDYYDFTSQFQFSQMKLQDVSHFSTGDSWVVQTVPPVNEVESQDRVITMTGPEDNTETRNWVFADSIVRDKSTLDLKGFWLDGEGYSKNSSLELPTKTLLQSPEVVGWTTESNYMTGVFGDGLPANYQYGITTHTGLAAAVATLEPGTQPVTEYIQKAPIPSQLTLRTETLPVDLDYNGDILLEVVDKAGTDVTFRVISNQVAKDGTYKSFHQDITLKADGATTQNMTIGDITINNLSFVPADNITVGDKLVYHVTAASNAGDKSIVLQGTNTSDPALNFSRTLVLDQNVEVPQDINLSYFNINEEGEWNNANLKLNIRGMADGETASFTTGINFDTSNSGIFQTLRSLSTELQRTLVTESTGAENLDTDLLYSSFYDRVSERIGEIDDEFSMLINAQARVGAKTNRLETQKNRLIDATANYTELLSNVEDADMAKVIMELMAQENVYKASLSAGSRIIQPTLVDFLK